MEEPRDTSVRNFAIGATIVTLLIVSPLLYSSLSRDTWELERKPEVLVRLDEADAIQDTDIQKAYDTYSEILEDAQDHKIEDPEFRQRLTSARQHRQRLEKVIKARKAERARAIAEKRRQAEQRQQAERARQAEKARIAAILKKYKSASQSPRYLLNVLKKLEARTEVGVNYAQYMQQVGEAWGEVKVFVESSDGKDLREFSGLLRKAAMFYKLGLDVWHAKIQDRSDTLDKQRDSCLQLCWARASVLLGDAESLLDPARVESVLRRISVDDGSDSRLIELCESLK